MAQHPDLNRLREIVRNQSRVSVHSQSQPPNRNQRRANENYRTRAYTRNQMQSSQHYQVRTTVRKKFKLLLVFLALIIGFFFNHENLLNVKNESIPNFITKAQEIIKGNEEIVETAIIYDPIPSTEFVYVTTKGANIRLTSSMDAVIVTVVKQDTKLTFLYEKRTNGDNRSWLKVKTSDGQIGWISEKIIRWEKLPVDKLKTLAEEGNVNAMRELALAYDFGENIEQSDEDAFKWYKKAADHGDPYSQLCTGWIYHHGDIIKKSYEQAVKYYQLAAAQGNGSAINNLGYMYAYGLGVEVDGLKAKELYQKSIATDKNSVAITNLATLYMEGLAIERDIKGGIALLNEAVQMGHEGAKKLLEEYNQRSEEEFIALMEKRGRERMEEPSGILDAIISKLF